jgi:hypothetical protein
MKRAVALLVVLLVAANLLGSRLRESQPPPPLANRIGLGPLLGGVMTGAFRPLLANYLFIRADILAGQGRYDEQVTLFLTMTRLYPHNDDARGFIGWWLAYNSKSEAQDPALGWRWSRDGLDILVEIPEKKSDLSQWFIAQCGQNAFDFMRYAGRDWAEERYYRARARAWGERQYGMSLDRFDLGLQALGDARGTWYRALQGRLLAAGLVDDWMKVGRSPKADAAVAIALEMGALFDELPEYADEYRREAARLRAVADNTFDLEKFPGATHHDANALWALGMHQRDPDRLRMALALFEKLAPLHRFPEEKASIREWITWIEEGSRGPRPRMPFDP